MRDAVIIDAVRTPIGKYAGVLKDVRPDDLLAHVIARLVERTRIPVEAIEDVYAGCANQAGEDNRNVARMAVLIAGLPIEIPGATVNRLCGSGLEAVNDAARAIQTDSGDVFIAGGVESMTRAPLVMLKATEGFPRGTVSLADAAFAAAGNSHGQTALALSMTISYLAATSAGTRLVAEAQELRKGHRSGFYQITVKTEGGELVATCQAVVHRKKDSFVGQ